MDRWSSGGRAVNKAGLFAGLAAGVAAIAAILTGVSTILTKPAEIAAKVGILKAKPVTVDVSLADVSRADAIRLIFGKDAQEVDPDLQAYARVGDVYCVPRGALGHCPGASAPVQTARVVIDYVSDDAFSGPFGPAVPIFDIASVRPDERDLLLVAQRVDYERLAADLTPYVELLGLDDNEGRIGLISHSLADIESITLTFRFDDVIPTDAAEAWVKAHRAAAAGGQFPEHITLTRGALFQNGDKPSEDFVTQAVDLRPAILRRFPGTRLREYPDYEPEAGKPASMYLEGLPPGWRPAGQREDKIDAGSGPKDVAVMIVGRLLVKSRAGQTYQSQFTAPVIVSAEKGYGAGEVQIDSKVAYVIDDQLEKGSVSKLVKLVLSDAAPTVRTQAALLFKRSGRYRVRFVYSTQDKADFMASEWITVQAFASPNFMKAYFAR